MKNLQTAPAAWLRFNLESHEALKQIGRLTGVTLEQAMRDHSFNDGAFCVFRLKFLHCTNSGSRSLSQVLFMLSHDQLITLEPNPVPEPLEQAVIRLNKHIGRCSAAFCLLTILQTITDAANQLIDSLHANVNEGLVQSNSVLEQLDRKGRDFGVTDVVSTQVILGGVEEILSKCEESLIQIALAARHTQSRLPAGDAALSMRFEALLKDAEAVEEDADFLHERVRFLQAVISLALNVKQNQIIKVFTVITAVFLPALLVSTYYSMNLEVLPLLEWPLAEPATLIFTVLLAVLPIIYVKHSGWLR